ncbi:MAG: hypothetical protein ACJ73E_00055 [Mycobacteriales bacterium]
MAVGLAAPDIAVTPPAPPAVAAPAATGPRRRLLGRPRRTADAEQDRQRVLADARALLEQARELVRAGWVQDAFYVVRDRKDRVRPVSPFGLLLLSRSDVVGACLVGAVAHATARADRRSRRAPAALAVDMLWTELVEGDGRTPPDALDFAHPAARAGRVRELARWNDEPGRSRADVLDLIDRAVSRTILDAVR